MAHAARSGHTWVLVAGLQVQANPHRLSDISRKQLRVVRPCLAIEVDQHVVTDFQIGARRNIGDLKQPRPHVVELFGEFLRSRVVRAAVNTDGEVALGKLEAVCALHIDGASIRLGQQPAAHEHHRAVLEGCDPRPLERRLLEEGVADLRARRRLDLRHIPTTGPLGELLLKLPL
eukprot:7383515-Prymnesium_polylepis.2